MIVIIVAMMAPVALMAQSPQRRDLPRTRIIPYPDAEKAAGRAMTAQRFMQPITEWQPADDGGVVGEFTYPFSWIDRHIFIRIEGMAQPYEVLINGTSVGTTTNGHAATEFDITKIAKEDKNRVTLRPLGRDGVAVIECFDVSPSAPVAYVISQPRVRVRDVAWNATRGMGGVVNVDFAVVMRNETLNAKTSRLYYNLYLNDTIRLTGGHLDVALDMHGVDTMRFGATLNDTFLWRHGSPTMLSLRLENRIENRKSEVYDFAVALRELRFEDGLFYINGEHTPMEWYDVTPCATVDAVRRLYDEGHRVLRFGAGMVHPDVLEYCDNHGIYVALTAPINSSMSGTSRMRNGNPSNDPAWCDEYVERVVSLIETTERHPSVVAYFLADDSANGICLYEAYLAAKRVSPYRPIFYTDGGNEWNSDGFIR